MSEFRETEFFAPITCKGMDLNGGTWTYNNPVSNSGVASQSRAAGAGTAIVSFPIHEARQDAEFGLKIVRVILNYRLTTADATSITPVFYATNIYKAVDAAGTNIDATVLTTTNTPIVTAAATDRSLTITFNPQAYESLTGAINPVSMYGGVSFVLPSSSVLTVYDSERYYIAI